MSEENKGCEGNRQHTLQELQAKIERQTGFPSELKAFKFLLEAGWNAVANPRIKSPGKELEEIDFVANLDLHEKRHQRTKKYKDIVFSLNIVADVKKYSRPLILFSSARTERDNDDIYGVASLLREDKQFRSDWFLSEGLAEALSIDKLARTAVVMNDKGERPKDFDLGQISSTINLLYRSAHALEESEVEMAPGIIVNDKEVFITFIVPVLVYDGEIFEYSIQEAESTLGAPEAAILHSNIIGEDYRLSNCPAYIVKLDYLPQFLQVCRGWAAERVDFGFESQITDLSSLSPLKGRKTRASEQ